MYRAAENCLEPSEGAIEGTGEAGGPLAESVNYKWSHTTEIV